jgi:hypothetical protein
VKWLFANPRWALLLLLSLAALGLSGCASTESENVSERPWNAPQGWENGLPGAMYDRYR